MIKKEVYKGCRGGTYVITRNGKRKYVNCKHRNKQQENKVTDTQVISSTEAPIRLSTSKSTSNNASPETYKPKRVKSRVQTVPLRSYDAFDEAIAMALHPDGKEEHEPKKYYFTKEEVLTLIKFIRR